jgi:hypothetical protein
MKPPPLPGSQAPPLFSSLQSQEPWYVRYRVPLLLIPIIFCLPFIWFIALIVLIGAAGYLLVRIFMRYVLHDDA